MKRFSLLSLLMFALPVAAQADEREWTVTPYLLGSQVSGDLTVNGTSSEFDADFSDILENLEFGGMLRVGVMGERWGGSFDASFIGLGQSSRIGDARIDLDQTILEAAAVYRPREHVDVLFGVRYWDVDAEIDFALPALTDARQGEDWIDPFIGVRLHADLGADWRFIGRFDVGGFDVGSELSWNAEIVFGWRANELFELFLGYRVIDVEYEDGVAPSMTEFDVNYSGPEIGFGFHF